MTKYPNRREAGKVLAENLRRYANRKDVIVLALPRGGVPVAFEIAQTLNVPLDVFIVRKLGVPGHKELAMGAIASGDVRVFNQSVINDSQVTKDEIEAVIQLEQKELARREALYRGNKPFALLKNKVVILVDDGIATGATVRAAIASIRKLNPDKLVLAVPVAQKDMLNELQYEVDEYICPMQPVDFQAVGLWYDDFSQTEDDEVDQLLKSSRGTV